MSKIEIGSVVILKGGQGPMMTVIDVMEDGKLVTCWWHNETGEWRTSYFPEAALVDGGIIVDEFRQHGLDPDTFDEDIAEDKARASVELANR